MKRISFEIALIKSVSQMECLYTVLSTCSSTPWTVYPNQLHTSHPWWLPIFSQYDEHMFTALYEYHLVFMDRRLLHNTCSSWHVDTAVLTQCAE